MIDLRSDTVTRPTPAMYERMRQAPVGDDGLDGDPTAVELERCAADLLGKPAGLFVASGTMANLITVLARARQGRIICEAGAHIRLAEAASCDLAGAGLEAVPGDRGAMDLTALSEAIDRSAGHDRLVTVETSHNYAGGTVLPLQHLADVHALAADRQVSVHLDGARLFNACAYLDATPAVVSAHCDSAAFCLSKGLSAPVGSILVGEHGFIETARVIRKHLGGQMRQVGVLAAAGLEALTTMRARLSEDHRRAGHLAAGLNAIGGPLTAPTPQTNIVLVDVAPSRWTAERWRGSLEEAGVRVRTRPDAKLRCVTHRHLEDDDVDQALEVFRRLANADR